MSSSAITAESATPSEASRASLSVVARAAVEINGLTKVYRIPEVERELTLAEQALRRVRHPLSRTRHRTLKALDGLSLSINPGEAVGLIGRNGAGKSTLLKVLSRITPPTSGLVRLRGRVGSLLEVGTGFHPELTGRENIQLAGAILGMTRAEIAQQFDSIVEFAGVAKFLELPVKRYSSGMYVRLAFAVAAHLRSEILLVDEVLAVGDTDFQRLSAAKMREVVADGRVVILVSHQMRTILEICGRAVVLDRGTVAYDGDAQEAISQYLEAARDDSLLRRDTGSLSRALVIAQSTALKSVFRPDEEKVFSLEIEYDGSITIDRYFVSVIVRTADGSAIAHCDSNAVGHWFTPSRTSMRIDFSLEHPWLQPGRYYLDLALCNAGVIDSIERVCWFTVDTELPYPVPPALEIAARDVVLPSFDFSPDFS